MAHDCYRTKVPARPVEGQHYLFRVASPSRAAWCGNLGDELLRAWSTEAQTPNARPWMISLGRASCPTLLLEWRKLEGTFVMSKDQLPNKMKTWRWFHMNSSAAVGYRC